MVISRSQPSPASRRDSGSRSLNYLRFSLVPESTEDPSVPQYKNVNLASLVRAPDLNLAVYGDVNSTAAAALVCFKLLVPPPGSDKPQRTSERKAQANRENAKKSTGPRTSKENATARSMR